MKYFSLLVFISFLSVTAAPVEIFVSILPQQISIKRVQPDEQNLLHTHHEHKDKHRTKRDPHAWLSPVIAIRQTRIIMQELRRLLPEKKYIFYNNYKKIDNKLNVLN